jgi:hypothetical protein
VLQEEQHQHQLRLGVALDFNRKKSQKQEKRVAEDIGGREQPGSGAPDFYKGDVRKTGKLRVECKTTSAQAYHLRLVDIEKIKVEALRGGDENWAMQVEFQTQTGGKRFAVIDWQVLLDLLEAYEQTRYSAPHD